MNVKKTSALFISSMFLILCAITVSADTQQAIEDYLLTESYYRQHQNDMRAPVSTSDAGEEFVDMSSGALSYSATDLSLPGKAGFDLNIVRKNRSDMYFGADGYHKLISMQDEISAYTTHSSDKKLFKYFVDGNTSSEPVYVAYDSEAEMLQAEIDGGIYSSADYTLYAVTQWTGYNNTGSTMVYNLEIDEDCADIGFEMYDTFYNYASIPKTGDVHLVRDKTQGSGTITYINVVANERELSQSIRKGIPVASGWYIELPELLVVDTHLEPDVNKDIPPQYRETLEYGRFFDPETGITVCYESRYRDWINSGYDDYETELQGSVTEVVSYDKYGDVFEDDTNMYTITIKDSRHKVYPNDYSAHDIDSIKNEFDYRTVIERYDGVKFYFKPQGSTLSMQLLVKKEDRFGNSINYYYHKYHDDYGYMMGMIDSCDRHIRLYCTQTLKNVNEIHVNNIPAVKYDVKKINNNVADPENKLDDDDVYALKVTKNNDSNNPNYVIYSYLGDNQPYIASREKLNQNGKDMGLYSTVKVPTYMIKSVETSAGGRVDYSYTRSVGQIPDNEYSKKIYNRLTSRVQTEADGTIADITNYSYDHSDIENRISTMTKGESGYTVTEKYNKDSHLTEKTTVSEIGQTKEEYTYTQTAQGKYLPSQIIKTQSDASGNNPKSITTNYTYNEYHQVIEENNGQNVVVNTYNKYGLPMLTMTNQSSEGYIGVEYLVYYGSKTIGGEKTFVQPNYSTKTYKDLKEYTYNEFGDVASIISKRYTDGVKTVMEAREYYTYSYLPLTDNHSGAALIVSKTDRTGNVTDSDGTNVGIKNTEIITEYDIFGNIIKITDSKDAETLTEYDALRRPVKVINPDGTFKTVEYDDVNNQIIQTDENGNTSKLVYDSLGRQWQTYAKKNGTWQKISENSYDNFGRIIKTSLFLNGVEKGSEEYTYYNDNSIKSETIKEGNTTLSSKSYVYEPGFSEEESRTAVTVETGLGTDTTVYTYTDKWGRKTKEEVSFLRDGETKVLNSVYTTDYLGNILTSTDYKGNVTAYSYDHKNRVIKTTLPDGTYTETLYNSADKPISVRDYNGNITTMSYDFFGNLRITETPVSDGVTSTTNQYYDLNGNLTRIEQQNNKPGEAATYSVVRNIYDSRNRLVSTVGNDGTEDKITTYEYDNVGNVIKVTAGLLSGETPDPSKHSITTYGYDSMNNPISATDALGNTSTAQYDLLGNMVSAVDRNGNAASYTYDALGRIKTANVSDITVSYEYNLLGQISKMTDSTGVTEYEYDGLGLLTKETKGDIIKAYNYDNNGNRIAFTLTENGETTLNQSYAYDSKNRLVSVVSNGETTTYSYDANGNLLSESTGTKVSASYSYNKANQLTSLTNSAAGKTVANYSVSYYLDGNKSAIAEVGQPTVSYVYDGMGQLVSETTEGVSTTIYAYDPRQNRTSKTLKNERQVIESVSNYTYDLNNRLLQEVETVKEIQNTTDYYYDNNGNQITKLHSVIEPDFLAYNKLGIEEANPMAEFYSYDALNRLESSVVNGKTTTYTYDGNNLRQTKTTDGITTKHIYDGINVVSDTVGTTRNIYVRGLSLISGTINGANSYYHKNTHGDVISLTDETGAVTTDYRYDAFGNQESVTETDANPFRYCGEYQDLSSGLIYLRNRYYDQSIGRFITEDPARDGFNWYVYCGNNPVMFVDPSGNIREPGYVNGVWCENPDAYEFGKKSDTYKILVDLGNRWESGTSKQRDEYSALAENVRRLAREGTPIQYAQDKILNQLHKNAKVATDYQATMTTGFSGFMYQLGGGNYLADSSSFLIGMAYGDWNYKYDSNWQVPYDYFDGNDMNVDNNKNWRPWMYFDGMLVSADKFGNINMAYVGVKMSLPYSVFQNFATTDKDDAFWVQYGINMAEQGR